MSSQKTNQGPESLIYQSFAPLFHNYPGCMEKNACRERNISVKKKQLLLIFVDPVAPLAHIGISTYGSGVI